MTSRRAAIPAVLAIALVILAAAVSRPTGPQVIIEERVLPSRSGNPIRAVFVLPHPSQKLAPHSMPAVIAIPPYSIPPEAMETICIELAQRGCACAIPDFFGKAPEESRQRMGANSLEIMTWDALAIIAGLRALPFVDPARIGACGHSVGGTVTVLAGIADPRLKSAVPIGMWAEFLKRRPQNLLFLSGLYDEIHSPSVLLDILALHGVTDSPENDTLYGDPRDGSARQVTIVPTTDHFIETFDHRLIRELLDWYALTLSEPGLSRGPLLEWRRRVAGFFLMICAAALYFTIAGRAAGSLAGRLAPHKPNWLITRLLALPIIFVVLVLWAAGDRCGSFRSAAIDLMLALLLAHEAVSLRALGVLRHGRRSPFRTIRSTLLLLAALGISTLISYGLTSIPFYFDFPGSARYYPLFALNMAVLFPLEVWGRIKPWFFEEMVGSIDPGALYFILAAMVVAAPGALARLFDRLSQEVVITVRNGLRPLDENGRPLPREKRGDRDAAGPAGATSNAIRVLILAALLALLAFLGWRRIDEGMLNIETAIHAGHTLMRYAVLPFLITALIVRTRAFRRLAMLD